jgi:hypothetical protein
MDPDARAELEAAAERVLEQRAAQAAAVERGEEAEVRDLDVVADGMQLVVTGVWDGPGLYALRVRLPPSGVPAPMLDPAVVRADRLVEAAVDRAVRRVDLDDLRRAAGGSDLRRVGDL